MPLDMLGSNPESMMDEQHGLGQMLHLQPPHLHSGKGSHTHPIRLLGELSEVVCDVYCNVLSTIPRTVYDQGMVVLPATCLSLPF